MIAAIYARKSTDQNGVADEAKSITRQIEHAKAFAARRGWTVAEACIFVDDGISGAELARRPGVQRLRAALVPRPIFQVLIVSEQSRLSRDTELLWVLKGKRMPYPRQRQGLLLAVRKDAARTGAEPLLAPREFLADSDPQVRLLALL